MLNAHQRFGWLSFTKVTANKTTSVRVRVDRLISESSKSKNEFGRAHLLSVIGHDTQIAALIVALGEGHHFTIEGPDGDSAAVRLGEQKPQTYRSSLQVQSHSRPIRHLIAVSQDFVTPTTENLVLAGSQPDYVWSSVAKILGLPGLPDWAGWFHEQLVWHNAITPLLGIGCSPIRVRGTKQEFLSWLGDGVRSGALKFPDENRAIHWPGHSLQSLFQVLPDEQDLPQSETT